MKDKMIYISSPSYSGSTLLTILLAEHPGTASIGELKASAFGDLEQYLCSCGERLLDCGFWLELERRVKARVGSFDLRTWGTHFAGGGPITNKLLAATLRGARFETLRKLATTLLPPVRGRFRQIMALNEAVIDCALEMAGVHAFIEGSKDPIRAKYLYETDCWDFFAVALIRDGRGVTNSYMRHEAVSMASALEQWMPKMQEIERLKGVLGDRMLTVRYEDLCDDPLRETNRILEFAGLTPLDELAYPIEPNDRHLLGNAMRLKSIDAVRSDEKWRNSLSAQDLKLFHARAGSIQARYGYSVD